MLNGKGGLTVILNHSVVVSGTEKAVFKWAEARSKTGETECVYATFHLRLNKRAAS